MATKDITDLQVVQACHEANEQRSRTGESVWTADVLQAATGEAEMVIYAAIGRAVFCNLLDYGVSLKTAWITPKGYELWKSGEGAAA